MKKKRILLMVLILAGVFTGCVYWPVTVKEMNFKSYAMDTGKVPVIYSDEYNISFYGLEALHPFDSKKYGKVHDYLIERNLLTADQFIEPGAPSREDLLIVHPESYLNALEQSSVVAEYAEMGILSYFPSNLTKRKILKPMLYATGGTILAGQLAVRKGWAINLGGGYHHASAKEGGGFCIYADITLSIRYLMKHNPLISKVMIIDLDAHQGNGHERDFLNNDSVFIVDVYNKDIYPGDLEAKKAIDLKVEVPSGIDDIKYINLLEFHLNEAFELFDPDIIYYNAGTDILEGDPLGRMKLSKIGIQMRDEMVFRYAFERQIPIVMLLSGGYQKTNYEVIGKSIANLKKKFNLF